MTLSLIVAVCVGVPAGTIAAVKRNSPVDALVTLFAMFGVAVPNFWFSMLLIWVFVVELVGVEVGVATNARHGTVRDTDGRPGSRVSPDRHLNDRGGSATSRRAARAP